MVNQKDVYPPQVFTRQVLIPENHVKDPPPATHRVTYPHDNLTRLNIHETIRVAEALYFCLTEHVTLVVRRFLIRNKLASHWNTDIDFSKMMQKISYGNRTNRYFLKVPMSEQEIGNSISARNELCHLDLNNLNQNWKLNFWTWIKLCRSVGEDSSANAIQAVYNRLEIGRYQHAIENKHFFFTKDSYQQNTAYGLSLILYSCLFRQVAPAIRNFLIRKKQESWSTNFDFYYNLKKIIEEQRRNLDYLARDAWQRNDSLLLNMAQEARNFLCHGMFSKVYINWKLILETWIKLVDVLNAKKASAEMKGILNSLLMAEERGLPVQPSMILFSESSFAL